MIAHSYPDKDIYRAYKQAKTGFKSIEKVRETVQDKIAAFAKKQGKSFVILGQRNSKPPYLVGNYQRVEIVFALTDIYKSN